MNGRVVLVANVKGAIGQDGQAFGIDADSGVSVLGRRRDGLDGVVAGRRTDGGRVLARKGEIASDGIDVDERVLVCERKRADAAVRSGASVGIEREGDLLEVRLIGQP
jgi:hypothetical protein